MECGFCGKEIKPDDVCYQIRTGHLDENSEFVADEDYAYHCQECGVQTGNFVSC